jgi:hypothetical protein
MLQHRGWLCCGAQDYCSSPPQQLFSHASFLKKRVDAMFLGSHISRQISKPHEQGQASYSKESPFLRRSLRKLAKSGKAWTRLRRNRQEVSWTDLTLWRKRVTLSFKGEVAFVKMPPPSVRKLLMSDSRFNWSLRHGRFYCTLLLSIFSDEGIRFSNFAALS